MLKEEEETRTWVSIRASEDSIYTGIELKTRLECKKFYLEHI